MKIALLLSAAALCFAADELRPFEGQAAVGTLLRPGTLDVDETHKRFTIGSSGENMWARADDFHFVWKKMSGDVALSASMSFPQPGGNAHRKAILMIRQSLDTDSAYVDAALHGDGLTSLQSRETKGGLTKEVGTNAATPARMRIEKRGEYFLLFMAREGEPLHLAGGSMRLPLDGPFYVGIGVCAHDKNAFEKVVFSDVKLESLPPTAGPGTLFSTLETVVITSTDRRVASVAKGRLESPAWAMDGKSVSFFEAGKPKRSKLDGAEPMDAPELPLVNRTLDVTPNGQWIYFASARSGTSHVWKMNAEGADQAQVTQDEYQDFDPHLSPDGTRLVFLSALQALVKDTDVLLRVMNLTDGKITVVAKLIGGRGTLGPGPWSPDGKRLTFVSYQYLPE